MVEWFDAWDAWSTFGDRLMVWGKTLYQTNFSDAPDDTCIDDDTMLEIYDGFLGPRCGNLPQLKRPVGG